MVVVRKMKEKCKDAARMRREKERAEFVELSKLLPLPSSTTSQLDKASIIRLTSSYLRMRAAFPNGLGEHWGTGRMLHNRSKCLSPIAEELQPQARRQVNEISADPLAGVPAAMQERPTTYQPAQIRELGSLILQTLDGFVFALHKDGKIMYISETASVHLGLPQIDLTGSSVFEYIHPSDCNDLNELFNLSEHDKIQLETMKQTNPGDRFELGRSFCMRMKCILPKRNAGLVSNGYKAIHCSGYLKVRCNSGTSASSSRNSRPNAHQRAKTDGQFEQQESANLWEGYTLVAVGHSLLPTATTEVKLGTSSFMFRASLDFKLYYFESPVIKLLGYDQIEMIGQSLYQFIHVEDCNHLAEAHKLLLNKGQVVTRYYRLMRRTGGYLWIETHATLVNNPRSMPKPQHIVSVCYIIGDEHMNQSGLFSQKKQDSETLPAIRRNAQPSSEMILCNPHANDTCLKRAMCVYSGRAKRCKSSNQNQATNNVAGSRSSLSSKTIGSTGCSSRRYNNDKIQMANAAQAPPVDQLSKSLNCIDNEPLIEDLGYAHELCLMKIAQNSESSYQSSASLAFESHVGPIYHTIGSTRRPSEDSCSVVSSITSTSTNSSLQNYHHSLDSFTSNNQMASTYGLHNCSQQQYQAQARPTLEADATCSLDHSIEGPNNNCLNSSSSLESLPTMASNNNQTNFQPTLTISTSPTPGCETVWLMPLVNANGNAGSGASGWSSSSSSSSTSSSSSSSSSGGSGGSSSGSTSSSGGSGGGRSSGDGGKEKAARDTNEQSQQIPLAGETPLGPFSHVDHGDLQHQTNSRWVSGQPLVDTYNSQNQQPQQLQPNYSNVDFHSHQQADPSGQLYCLTPINFSEPSNQTYPTDCHEASQFVSPSPVYQYQQAHHALPSDTDGMYSLGLRSTELPTNYHDPQHQAYSYQHYHQPNHHYHHHTVRLGDGYTHCR